jgi:hypothetical protein
MTSVEPEMHYRKQRKSAILALDLYEKNRCQPLQMKHLGEREKDS